MASIWETPGLDERMIDLRSNGNSCAVTATKLSSEFGIQISRCAVIGRQARIGHAGEWRVPNATRRQSPRSRFPALPIVAPEANPTPFAQSKKGQCRWLLDDHTICGAQCWESSSWCVTHYRAVFVKRSAA